MNRQLFVIWVTHSCNLRCTYCYEIKDNNLFMSRQTSELVVAYISKYVIENDIKECDIHFHGGEPLLNFDIISKIVRELKGCKFNYSITTNATLLNREIAEKLEKYFCTISVSLDGSPVSHDSNRKTTTNKETFLDVINGLSYFRDLSKIRIRMTVTTSNVKDFYNNILYLSELGFTWIEPGIDLFCKWNDELADILEVNLSKIRDYYDRHPQMHVFDSISNEFYIMHGCEGGKKNINIDFDGTLYPCSFSVAKKDMIIGDVKNGVSEKLLRNIRNKYSTPLKECNNCTMTRYCIATNCRILQEVALDKNDGVLPILCKLQNIKYKLFKNYHSIGKGNKDYEDK